MANYTQNYGLHQWESTDNFLRSDFNTDFALIDAALAGKGDCSVLFGSYVGTGECGSAYPNQLTFPAGCRPELLIVYAGSRCYFFAADVSSSFRITSEGYVQSVTWTANGLSWYVDTESSLKTASNQLNSSGTTYYYAAFR